MSQHDSSTVRILVWDLPTRLFHWLLAGSVLGAFSIAVLVDDESPRFALHMLLGAVAALVVVLRLVWGVIGTRWARFSSFAFGPKDVIGYLRGAIRGRDERHVGHNPGSSWVIFAMFALTLGLAATGVFMSSGGKLVKELHEALAYTMIGLVGAHLLGVVWYTARHRENITTGLIDGRKLGDPSQAIASRRPASALLFLALVGMWGAALVRGYDPASRRVSVLGQTVQLGEQEGGERGKHHERGHHEHHADD